MILEIIYKIVFEIMTFLNNLVLERQFGNERQNQPLSHPVFLNIGLLDWEL